MKAFTVLMLILVSSVLAFAEDKPPKLVRVTGVSEVKVVPDRAVLEIGVEKQNVGANAGKKLCRRGRSTDLGEPASKWRGRERYPDHAFSRFISEHDVPWCQYKAVPLWHSWLPISNVLDVERL